jgi:hypothetical protein
MKEIDYKILSWIEEHHCLSIKQAARMFYEGDYARDKARKKLKLLEDYRIIKSYKNDITKEKIYYVEKKLSPHDLYVLDFYSLLVFHGCTNIKIEKQPRLMKDILRPDAFIQFEYQEYIYNVLLEIDLSHFTSDKMALYFKLKREDWLIDRSPIFPLLVIVGANVIKKHYKELDIVYLPFSMDGFQKVLVDAD